MKFIILAGTLAFAAQVHAQSLPLVAAGGWAKELSAPPTAGTCANFSGVWTGACTTNGRTTSETVVIKQLGCDYIFINGAFYAIGGSHAETYTIPQENMTTNSVSSMVWSADRQSLASVLDVQVNKAGSTTYVDRVLGAASVGGGRLVSSARGSLFQAYCEFR